MALVQRMLSKIKPVFFVRVAAKNYSTETSIKKTVFISQSKDVYTNLALQEWINSNIDLRQQHVLMLWQNDPCVMVSENQNPWFEVDVDNLQNITKDGVKLARQKSNGPSTYHDNGNLNMTFFTPKERIDEIYNMNIISRALYREFSVKVDPNQGDYMMHRNYRISGNTKFIGTKNAYHHCSLLVRVNKIDWAQTLMKQEIAIQKESTKVQTEPKIMNLCEENFHITVDNVIKTVGWEYLRTHASVLKDLGNEFANNQKGFHMVNPTESWFPGLQEIRNNLSKWEWIFGATPNFKVNTILRLPEGLYNHFDDVCEDLVMGISVNGGLIKDITLSIPSGLVNSSFNHEINAVTRTLIGQKFSIQLLTNLQESIKHLGDDKDKFAPQPLRQASFL